MQSPELPSRGGTGKRYEVQGRDKRDNEDGTKIANKTTWKSLARANQVSI